ncbi:MAG: hypothetical protein ACTSVU_05330 [Promethearchaeota archaeon]
MGNNNNNNKGQIWKKYPDNIIIPTITYGLVITSSQYNSLLLSDILPQIYQNTSFFLTVYAIYPKLSRITCYPLDIDHVWKLKIVLNSSTPTILQKITGLFTPNQTIHTTGLSQKGKEYVVENYLIPLKSWEKAKQLTDKIKALSEVKKCQIELI